MTATSKAEKHREKLLQELEGKRVELGLSKRALAKDAGLHPDYYRHWVAGTFLMMTSINLDAVREALQQAELVQQLKDSFAAPKGREVSTNRRNANAG